MIPLKVALARVAKDAATKVFAGGCTRNFTGCPLDWNHTAAQRHPMKVAQTRPRAAFAGGLLPTAKLCWSMPGLHLGGSRGQGPG